VYALDGDQAWLPVSALNVSNADISAHFLAQNSVQYLAPVLDPWLSANQLYNDSEPGLELILYGPDAFVSVMACTDQYQICNPGSSPYDCTIVGSQKDLREGFLQIGLNPYQLATARRSRQASGIRRQSRPPAQPRPRRRLRRHAIREGVSGSLLKKEAAALLRRPESGEETPKEGICGKPAAPQQHNIALQQMQGPRRLPWKFSGRVAREPFSRKGRRKPAPLRRWRPTVVLV